MAGTLRSLLDIARKPVRDDVRASLKRSWEGLPEEFRTPQQMFGRQGNPCGATIGAMPRCDFACRGCYLGEEANHVKALPVEAIKSQMRTLRPVLGNNGNLQLTDGEVTLRPVQELVELLRYADEIGLIPMLMTHGDSFRRQPGLLERLMIEGGLREISIHVDTTMRGRTGAAYKEATREEELNPLREEFAGMIRSARKSTGLGLVAATTMTVTRDNLAGVTDVVRCVARNVDAYKILSFQPIAQVGRTEDGLGGGIDVDELWRRVAEGLGGAAADRETLDRSQMWLGHRACNRYVHGFMLAEPGREPGYYPIWIEGDPVQERTLEGYLARFGGASFRRDTRGQALARAFGIVAQAPGYWAREVLPYFWHQAQKMSPGRPWGLVLRLLTGRAQVRHFNIVSHHFMGRDELATPLGRERLDLCVFRVPIGDKLVSMCEVNAMGVRDGYYEDMRAGREPGLGPEPFRPLGRAPALAEAERAKRALP
jgi:hypothetical protein